MITLELPTLDLNVLKTQISWLNNKDVVRYSEQRHKVHTVNSQIKYIRSFIEHPDNAFREIRLDGALIGTISAYIDKKNRVADVGIMLGPDHQKQGHGFLAWTMFCDEMFANLGMRRIEGGCMAANEPMIKLFRKYGMREEGRRMSHFQFEGSYSDLVLYGRFR